MTAELDSAVQSVHRTNIDHYSRLLITNLTDLERQFVERRLAEEQEALHQANNASRPFDLVSE